MKGMNGYPISRAVGKKGRILHLTLPTKA
jgi:hypothetical protein